MKYLFLVLFFSLIQLLASAQDTSTYKKIESLDDIPHETPWEKWMWVHRSVAFLITRERKPAYDTLYIRSYRQKLIVTIPFSTRLLQFDLVDWKENKRLQYSPNFRYDIGIGISSRWATFIAHTGIVFFNSNNSERGVTKFRDYQLNLYGKKIVSDLIYQRYTGFYVANSGDFNYTGGPYHVRPDVRADMFSASSHYVFNHGRFSYRSTFAFTETQLKSAGSFLLGGYYTLFGVRADSSLVSTQFTRFFDPYTQIREGSVQSFGINAGYIYTRVRKKLYSTGSLLPGIGLNQTSYDRADSSSYRSPLNAAAKMNIRVGFGYDNGKFYSGLLAIYDYYLSFSKSNATFNHNFGKCMVFIGYRFDFEKTEKKILRKLSLIDYK